MNLQPLFQSLAAVFDGSEPIEIAARNALLQAAPQAHNAGVSNALAEPFLAVMSDPSALPVCEQIARAPLHWTQPSTSSDSKYIEHSRPKVHVELLGPKGLAKSEIVRLGLYGMLPNAEYGIRTHPAEEMYVMLAGDVYWQRDKDPYRLHQPGQRSHHPSMMRHGNKTEHKSFMSVYVWHGDISTEQYNYEG